MDGVEANGEDRQTADSGKRIRRQWTAEEKRRIVREAERPGAVGCEVAQRHGVHASVLHRWRTEFRVGASRAKKAVRTVRLLPSRFANRRRHERRVGRSAPRSQSLTVTSSRWPFPPATV